MVDTIIELLIYAVFPYYKRKKMRAEEWHGVVEEKNVKGDYSLGKYRLFVVFRTDEGQKIKMKMSEEQFGKYELRMRYHKKKGEDFPDPES